MGLRSLSPQPKTTKAHPDHPKCPYLLRDLRVDHPNHAWASDITYIQVKKGFLYLVAIMDWHSRKVLTWRVSNTMTADFCVATLHEALALYRTPEIFNTDQGSQGGFNWSSQHLNHGGVNGQTSGVDEGVDGAVTDEVARRAVLSQGDRARILA